MQVAYRLKRRGQDGQVEVWNQKTKRPCLEAEFQVSEHPMETYPNVTATNQQVMLVQAARLSCLRCLSGEPGHINHIMAR